MTEGDTADLGLGDGASADPLTSITGDGTGAGSGIDVPMGLLGELVEMFNGRFGADLSDADAIRPVQHLIDKAAEIGEDEGLRAQAIGNTFEDFERGKEDVLINATLQVQDINDLILQKLTTTASASR
jgi:type I restriction enzyme R subunit